MQAADRSVLHVLPHLGGGGERYVHLLSAMPGYRFERVYLAQSASPGPTELARGLVDVVRRTRSHDILHVHGEAASALCLPLLAMRPSVVTLHGLHLVRRQHGVQRKAAALSLRAILRAADRMICVSIAERDELRQAVGPSATRRAIVIRNGVRIPAPTSAAERREVRQELGLADSEPVAIWVGSLDERKDPLTAVRAAEQVSVTLLVVGDGPLRREVEGAAGERVKVLGERADVPRLLGAADVYILTSRREGLALSLLEAMADRLAPVVTDLPENVEAVGKTGVLVPVGDAGALADVLGHLAGNVRERVERAEGAQRRASDLFDAERMVARTRTLYEEVLNAR